MSVKVNIFYPELKRLVGAGEELRLEGETVGECLADLFRRYPGADKLMFDSRGRLFRHVHVHVNQEGMGKAAMDRPVSDKDQIIIAVLASGG